MNPRAYIKSIHHPTKTDPFSLFVIGDIHFGSNEFDKAAFERDLNIVKETPSSAVIFLGDLVDAIGKSDKRFSIGKVSKLIYRAINEFVEDYKQRHNGKKPSENMIEMVMVDHLIDLQINEFIEYISKWDITDKILGVVSGNHEGTHLKYGDTDLSQRIANALGVEYLGYSFVYHLIFERSKTTRKKIVIYGMHGFGGGVRTYTGDKLRYIRHSEQYNAHICVYGHTHSRWAEEIVKLDCVSRTVKPYSKWVATVGSYQKTLSLSKHPGYAEIKGYPLRPLGCMQFLIWPYQGIDDEIVIKALY